MQHTSKYILTQPLKRGLTTKVYLALDAQGMPVRIIITDGTPADCTPASKLIIGITAEYLRADKAYDGDDIVSYAEGQGMVALYPLKKK